MWLPKQVTLKIALRGIVLTFALFWVALLPASADVVFSNLPVLGFSSSYNSSYFNVSVVFTVPAGYDYTLNSIRVQPGSAGTGYLANLHESTSTTIGLFAAQFNGTSTSGIYDLFSSSLVTLQAGETYAIEFIGTGASHGLSATLPTGTFTFENTLIYDISGGSSGTFSSISPVLELDVSLQLPPTASFSYTATDLTAQFTDTSSEVPTTWGWTFGDGGTSTLQNPTHTYTADGTYSACLTATNDFGSSSPTCQNVTVASGIVVTPEITPEATPPTLTPPPPPPPAPTCDSANFDDQGVVRTGIPDRIAYAINCRVLYDNHAPTDWLGGALYSEANLGVAGLAELNVVQAIDIFSPAGMTTFGEGAVFCLRGQGTLVWLAASTTPRHAEIIGSYTVPEFPGFTCATLFEPGTLILVEKNPLNGS